MFVSFLRGLFADIGTGATDGSIMVTTDTDEIYFGAGVGTQPRPLNATNIGGTNYSQYALKADVKAPDWQTATDYTKGKLVMSGPKVFVCLVAHTSTNFADDLSASKWAEVGSSASSGTAINEWQPNTYYSAGQLITHNLVLYQCLTSHLSATSFSYDVVPGSTKWQSIGEIIAQNGYLNQWTNLSVAANQIQYFTIPYTADFRVLPPSVLKVVNNPQNVVSSQNGFDATGAANLTYNSDYITVDGTMRLKTKFKATTVTLGTIGGGAYSLSKISINRASFKTIDKLEVC